MVLLLIGGLLAAASTFLPVWSNDTGHGRGCDCSKDFTFADWALYLPALTVAIVAVVRWGLTGARAPSPLPTAWLARRSAYRRVASRLSEVRWSAATSHILSIVLVGINVLACFGLLVIVLFSLELEGVGAKPVPLAHASLFVLAVRFESCSVPAVSASDPPPPS